MFLRHLSPVEHIAYLFLVNSDGARFLNRQFCLAGVMLCGGSGRGGISRAIKLVSLSNFGGPNCFLSASSINYPRLRWLVLLLRPTQSTYTLLPTLLPSNIRSRFGKDS